MATSKPTKKQVSKRVPKVRLAQPKGRPIQLRYTCPDEQREIRVSTGTQDLAEAQRQKEQLEAKLLLGIDAKPKKKQTGPNMPWEVFRDEYSRLKQFRSSNAKVSADVRLDVCERIVKPRRLQDMADPETLVRLQTELLPGRAEHTVKSYMGTLQAALNWHTK